MNKDYYTPQELADKLRVNVMTIYRYIKARKLTAHKMKIAIISDSHDNLATAKKAIAWLNRKKIKQP